jgi:hypothetical protein
MSRFIPSFHFDSPESKLKPEWAVKALNYYWHNTSNTTLLEGKEIKEIDDYSNGHWDMTPFKRIFKSLKRALDKSHGDPNVIMDQKDLTGLKWEPLPLIPIRLNAATSIVQKLPVEISCTANDPLAAEKKAEDIQFLKNKQEVEADLQEIADQMQLGKVDLGTTKHSDIPYSDSPYGLNLNEPDELDVFENLLYALNVESSFETALEEFQNIKNVQMIRSMEIRDQFKYGVSTHQGFASSLTGLPDIEYVFPDNIKCPKSKLPDYSDNTHRFLLTQLTPHELFNRFGSQIKSEKQLDEMLNNKTKGYACKNGCRAIDASVWDSKKINLVYCEVKSLDWIGIGVKKNSKRGTKFFTSDPSQTTERIWAQNTYCFWWLPNTEWVFNIERLDYAYRTKGQESFQNFTTNIYKSQERSAVELSIAENKKAQIADIKMQHAIIKSGPAGKYIDLKFIRGALTGLKDDLNEYSMQRLIEMAFEENNIIGDTQGFEGKQDGNFKPFEEIPGGLKAEITGYMTVISDANAKISQFTGANDQLIGQSANPEGLIGLQKLLINSSLNALYYCNEAMRDQYQKLFTMWGSCIKRAIENGGATKKAIVAIVGKKKAKLIDGLNEIGMHDFGIHVSIAQREQERAEFENELERLRQGNILSSGDSYMLRNIKNPKDAFALLAVKEKQFLKRQQAQREEQYAQQQQLIQQQGQNQVVAKEAEAEGKIKQIYAQGDVQTKVIQLANQLGLDKEQFVGLIKRQLQQERMRGQIEKGVRTMETKHELQNQEAL